MAPDGAALARHAEAAGAAAIERAWQQMAPDQAPGRRRGFTGALLDRAIEITVAVGSLVMGAQAAAVAWQDPLARAHTLPLVGGVLLLLVAMAVACVAGRGARTLAAVYAVAMPLSIVAWAVFTPVAPPSLIEEPWPYFLLATATGAAIVAWGLPAQLVVATVPALVFAAARIATTGGGADVWAQLFYDVSIALLLSLTFVVVATMLRGVGAGVDEARRAAVETYGRATATEASERELVEIAGLMHDSVLAALLAAARAESPRERELAVAMAREALNRLADAESDEPVGTNEDVDARAIAAELERAAAQLGVALTVAPPEGPAPRIPARAARALVLAATQAVANAVEHADARGLRVAVEATATCVRVVVSDEGPGFDLEAIPADRLGIRGSIFARVAAAGGDVEVLPGPDGTRVVISYDSEAAT
ncbi:ATP-binding protein [Microbacterium excoecariae]|uniref:ATP-binding protein n=1 Tax=Microbacterium excoecariae TaxID=2715210 RepID=UPI00140CF095|nr:ATP-binding protein [Microbacterium excoecariae]